jgi:hypothetical protein
VLTSRATDWFGQLEPRELWEITRSLWIAPEARDRIDTAGQGQGQGLPVTAGRPCG